MFPYRLPCSFGYGIPIGSLWLRGWAWGSYGLHGVCYGLAKGYYGVTKGLLLYPYSFTIGLLQIP